MVETILRYKTIKKDKINIKIRTVMLEKRGIN